MNTSESSVKKLMKSVISANIGALQLLMEQDELIWGKELCEGQQDCTEKKQTGSLLAFEN